MKLTLGIEKQVFVKKSGEEVTTHTLRLRGGKAYINLSSEARIDILASLGADAKFVAAAKAMLPKAIELNGGKPDSAAKRAVVGDVATFGNE